MVADITFRWQDEPTRHGRRDSAPVKVFSCQINACLFAAQRQKSKQVRVVRACFVALGVLSLAFGLEFILFSSFLWVDETIRVHK